MRRPSGLAGLVQLLLVSILLTQVGATMLEPLGYVSDYAGLVDADWKARIRSVCQDLERKTGVEMVVVVLSALPSGTTAEGYASALYKQWGIGSTQQEYGVLMLAVGQERQAVMTVGRSLGPVLGPSVLADIARQQLRPALRHGRYGEGLYLAVVAVASRLQDIRVGTPPPGRSRALGLSLTVLTALAAFGFLWWIARPDLRHPYGRLRRGEFWGSGQGGFGGDFGGFGGGTTGGGLQ